MANSLKNSRLPELLAPAGSPEALEAAFRAGADAVYLGGSRFNARLNAHNFDPAQLREAITHAHRMGGRVYLTLNTLVWDRELPDALEAAYEAASAGVDALIIADVGMLIIRGINVFPSQVESVILEMQEFEPQYMLVVDRVNNLDTLQVQVEVRRDFFSDDIGRMLNMKKRLADRLKSVLSISADVRLMEPGSIERSQGKGKHVIDNRILK